MFSFHAESLALNLCNTVDERVGYLLDLPPPEDKEFLVNYCDLLNWSEKAGLVSKKDFGELSKLAKEAPEHAQDALEEIIKIRETIFRITLAIIKKRAPSIADQNNLNHFIKNQPPQQMSWSKNKLEIQREMPSNQLLMMVPPIIDDVIHLLEKSPHDRLRICAMPECGWLFLDTSKNGRRRWCDMSDCGNRAKAKRFYEKNS